MAERVPVFFEFEHTVGYTSWNLAGIFENTESAIRVSALSINAGELLLNNRAIDRVLGRREQLGRVFTFPNRVLAVSESSVDLAENDERSRVRRILQRGSDGALASGQPLRISARRVTEAARDDCLEPLSREEEAVIVELGDPGVSRACWAAG